MLLCLGTENLKMNSSLDGGYLRLSRFSKEDPSDLVSSGILRVIAYSAYIFYYHTYCVPERATFYNGNVTSLMGVALL